MAFLSHSKIKTVLTAGVTIPLLAATIGCTTTVSPRYDDRPIYHDTGNIYKNKSYKNKGQYQRHKDDDIEDRIKQEARYPAIRQRAIRKVNGMGYQVTDIELDEKNNRGIFEIEAKRGGQEYEIELSYPDLRVIKLERD
ncbi:PepSY domain-containing protein [Psychrobacter jeotgali]|uniref:PepSY domain-containing protein n=1 Tax=Psychrobacter jeotgali TaxID=179010 RepID=UPI001918ABD4|nr:PepSY domain-containing protein [Psychrobacter jeotgali]